jgi:hypothetical protein
MKDRHITITYFDCLIQWTGEMSKSGYLSYTVLHTDVVGGSLYDYLPFCRYKGVWNECVSSSSP